MLDGEWFKFWRRNRQQLDIELLSMESRGRIFTNMMRYFDNGEEELLEMTPLEMMAFNVLKINVDDSFSEYEERQERNQRNGEKGGRPSKQETDTNPKNPLGFPETRNNPENPKIEDRSKNSEEEVRIQTSEVRGKSPEDKQATPPTLEEVKQFAFDNGMKSDPDMFFNYYAARGWKAGDDIITNWQALFRAWEAREKPKSNKQYTTQAEYSPPKQTVSPDKLKKLVDQI